ncbi:enoyl-CoA hydratase/isomerase [Thozetella sp. PMI_491]|nr:enoyl-CoA hydratase/isomerase [Thozetella sp. PMI_491]
MPLRAKIQLPRAAKAQMSTKTAYEIFKPEKGDDPEDVVFNSLYGLRLVELNRPKKLNSLNASMIRKIAPRLMQWDESDMAQVIVMKGAGEKAFCAGGDVAALAEWNTEGREGQRRSADYFALEYKLDHLIATLRTPYVAFMDGITMGGGVGLSVHAPFRIATERTVFAMPETTIGFFPDVGASFFLPRMQGEIGTYLALTSDRLKGPNVFYSGIATHYLHSTSLPSLESRLAELRFKDFYTLEERLAIVNATIEEFCTGLPYDEPIHLSGELRKAVDRCFSYGTVTEIIAALKEEDGAAKQWAQQTIETLHKRSPTAVNVALRQMRVGRKWTISETFEREYQMAAKFMKHPDFTEGVTALLKSKPPRAPKWEPATLEDIAAPEKVTEPFFQPDPELPSVGLLSEADYAEYPHKGLALPTERDVEELILQGIAKTPADVVRHFLNTKGGKQGVKEVVQEIVERKTIATDEGLLAWNY